MFIFRFFQVHSVKPKYTEEYEQACAKFLPIILASSPNLKLSGSWKSEIGEGDQFVHLWRFKNYLDYSTEFEKLRVNPDFKEFNRQIGKFVTKRSNQVCLSFTFWGDPQPRDTPHIYEMRSYSLKPGTLIEWGNNW